MSVEVWRQSKRLCPSRARTRVSNGVVIRTTVLSNIRRVAGRPCLVVQSAILSNCLGTIVEDVSVEELASLSNSTLGRVGAVVVGLSGAGTCAESGVEGAGSEDLDTHVGVLAVAVQGSVDGGVSKWDGADVPSRCCDRLADIAVRACNDDVEVVAVLAGVGCRGCGDWTAVVHTFNHSCRSWVTAGSCWIDAGVTFVNYRTRSAVVL